MYNKNSPWYSLILFPHAEVKTLEQTSLAQINGEHCSYFCVCYVIIYFLMHFEEKTLTCDVLEKVNIFIYCLKLMNIIQKNRLLYSYSIKSYSLYLTS